MVQHFKDLGYALGNMTRTAINDPVWALMSIVLSPFHAWRPIVGILVFVFVALLAATVAQMFVPEWAHAPVGIAGFVVALLGSWRIITTPLLVHFGPKGDDQAHGSARFAKRKELADLGDPSGIIIGRDDKGRLLRYSGAAHLLTMAPTRTGKGVGAIIPNLLTAGRSVLCVDPKGENARVTARQREAFGPVFCLDPFDISGQKCAASNPLDDLDPSGPDAAEDAATLADALVFDPPGEGGDAHWNEEAKALISGVLLYVAAAAPIGHRHLGTVREYLTLGPDDFAKLLGRMVEAGGLIARAANRHMSKSDKEASGVLSAAQRHTHFLDSPRMVQVLRQSDFRWSDLKAENVSVFLCLPPDRLATYSRWLRLVVGQALQGLAREPEKPASPVLFLLDEFAALGNLSAVERAMGLMAGYGVQLWPIFQDVHQLRDTYGRRAGTFLANAGVWQVFGVTDHDTAKTVSDSLGQSTVSFETMSRSLGDGGVSLSEQLTGRPLLTPDEVRTMPDHTELLFLQGRRPIIAAKVRYYEDPEFRGLYDPAEG